MLLPKPDVPEEPTSPLLSKEITYCPAGRSGAYPEPFVENVLLPKLAWINFTCNFTPSIVVWFDWFKCVIWPVCFCTKFEGCWFKSGCPVLLTSKISCTSGSSNFVICTVQGISPVNTLGK